MIVALFVNYSKPHAKELSKEIVRFLKDKNVRVVGPEGGLEPLSTVSPNEVDFVISLGGDGTILSVIHRHPEIEAPILGVNIGTLGFLAEITPDSLIPSLETVLAGNYKVQERLMLEAVKPDGTSSVAVNEVVVHRGPNYNLVDIGITVDGKHFNTFSADGVIIATPSGSTAYSLSAGGPIVSPDLQCVVITPICPHALSNRPIVISEPQSIEVTYISPYKPVEVALDGACRFELKTYDTFTIRPAKRSFRMISVPGFDYFSTLRTKLNWTGSLRN